LFIGELQAQAGIVDPIDGFVSSCCSLTDTRYSRIGLLLCISASILSTRSIHRHAAADPFFKPFGIHSS